VPQELPAPDFQWTIILTAIAGTLRLYVYFPRGEPIQHRNLSTIYMLQLSAPDAYTARGSVLCWSRPPAQRRNEAPAR